MSIVHGPRHEEVTNEIVHFRKVTLISHNTCSNCIAQRDNNLQYDSNPLTEKVVSKLKNKYSYILVQPVLFGAPICALELS